MLISKKKTMCDEFFHHAIKKKMQQKTAECESLAPRLPAGWNSGFGSLSFMYKHKQSSMQFIMRVDRMGSKVEVRALAIGDENIHRFERAVRDVVQSSSLPIRITMEEGQEDRSDLVEKLTKAFVSDEAITSGQTLSSPLPFSLSSFSLSYCLSFFRFFLFFFFFFPPLHMYVLLTSMSRYPQRRQGQTRPETHSQAPNSWLRGDCRG